ncbi:MAG TPA: hypothetical protein PLR01_08805, partial [Bacteroidales bacterium]|nr:hypothetical protein [Bacteroidales bacterium]
RNGNQKVGCFNKVIPGALPIRTCTQQLYNYSKDNESAYCHNQNDLLCLGMNRADQVLPDNNLIKFNCIF